MNRHRTLTMLKNPHTVCLTAMMRADGEGVANDRHPHQHF